MNASAELVFQADESSRPVHCLDTFNWTRFAQPCADVDAQCALLDEFCWPEGSQDTSQRCVSPTFSMTINIDCGSAWLRIVCSTVFREKNDVLSIAGW